VSAGFTLLFVCDDLEAGSRFEKALRETGLRLISMRSTERTILLTSDGAVDGVLVYQEDVQASSTIGLFLKTLLRTPVMLITTGWETMTPSSGIDAICYTNSLDDGMARIIATLFRNLVIRQPLPANVRHEHRDSPLRPFVVQPL